jgi:hypothetical protein
MATINAREDRFRPMLIAGLGTLIARIDEA